MTYPSVIKRLVVLGFILLLPLACSKGPDADVSPEAVKAAIKAHIDQNTGPHGGQFIFNDPAKGEQKLTFDYIHEGVTRHGEHYVACVDFVDAENNVYDVDFHVANKEGKLQVEGVAIHKEKGKKKP